jgi:hypothetical protein
LVTEVAESNERNAAGNGGVFSLLTGLAIGCAFAGLLELTRTFGAFGNLQFIPTEATEASFVSWTWAMLSAPVAVIVSAVIAALTLGRSRSALIGAAVSLIATLWLAARVLENVNGYLIAQQNVEASMPPLAADRWPFVFRHGVAVLLCAVVVAFASIAYALWRTRPRAIAFTSGLLSALLIIYLGGQFGFTAMAFLRLRNLSAAVALIDLVLVGLALKRRRFDVVLLLAFLLLAASAWRLDRSWRAMQRELPHGIETPAW